MDEHAVIIVGAGVAGLAAAAELVQAKIPVLLLEARERLGGRIFTVGSTGSEAPIELGAEFVHGAKNSLWEVLDASGLECQEATDRHWLSTAKGLTEDRQFWERLSQVFSKLESQREDRPFNEFLSHLSGVDGAAKNLAKQYVEGFHAADPVRISARSISAAEAAAEKSEGTRAFRLVDGYAKLIEWFWGKIAGSETEVRFRTAVNAVRWERGSVELEARTPTGNVRFSAPQVLLTLPLSLLQNQDGTGFLFEPSLDAKKRSLESMAMGSVVKITFQFKTAFWPMKDFGFLHNGTCRFSTWWSDARGPLLTAWEGGPQAAALASKPLAELKRIAMQDLALVFGTERQRIEELLVETYHHDWIRDPFSRGAYSYVLVGGETSAKELATPISGTLFFAGEAMAPEGEEGTVHGAFTSGRRAARKMIASKRRAIATRGLHSA